MIRTLVSLLYIHPNSDAEVASLLAALHATADADDAKRLRDALGLGGGA